PAPKGSPGSRPAIGAARSASDQAADRGQAQVLLAQRDDLLLELAIQPTDVVERGERPLEYRARARAAHPESPPARSELGAALAGDAIVIGCDRALLAPALGGHSTERFGAPDLLFADELFDLFEDLDTDVAASRAFLLRPLRLCGHVRASRS